MNNKSKIYGYYGGVRKENVYVPPPTPDFIPQTSSTFFTQVDRENFQTVAEAVDFFVENSPFLMVRTPTPPSTDPTETFTITTSGNPEDEIVYTAPQEGYNMNVTDGGYF